MEQAHKAPENMDQEIKEPDDIEPENMIQEHTEEETDSTLKFIEAVKEHKCIWDMQSEEYYNRTIYRAAWKSLLTPSEVPAANQPMDREQKAELKLKVAELQKVWVDLRDSYYKNEDPGRKYKDSLRFLHTAFQSREMEALLEFDEPSWDLMDLRTWNAKKKHIPRANRITDPAPEYEKARLIKRPRLSYHENLALERAKRKAIAEKKIIAEENATDIESSTDTENSTDTDNGTDIKNVTVIINETGIGNVTGTEYLTDKHTVIGLEKTIDKQNLNGIENTTYKDTVTGTAHDTDKVNVSGIKNVTGTINDTEKENVTKRDNTTDFATGTDNATYEENVTGTVNMTNTEKVTVKENVSGINNATDKDNTTGTENATSTETASGTENASTAGNATGKDKTTEENKPGTEPLSILEKAMRLYELDNPGVWSSDEDEAIKAARTYVESTTQTDETKEFPNMPIPTQINEQKL